MGNYLKKIQECPMLKVTQQINGPRTTLHPKTDKNTRTRVIKKR